jgi:hypothetical protein
MLERQLDRQGVGIPEGHHSKHPTFAALFDNRISGVSQAAFGRVRGG